MRRIVLIARREVVAYACTPSFWVALLIGPLLMALAALGAGRLGGPSKPVAAPVAIVAADPDLAAAATRALTDAARLGGRAVSVRPAAEGKAAKTTLRLVAGGGVAVQVEGERLSALDLALLQRDLAAAADLRARPATVDIVQPPAAPAPPADPGRFARFAMTTLLWLVLVGSLGMLLQAIVRERSNRALESLLSAARPSEIVLGKLAGVGVLSLLVVAAWLAGGASIAASPLGRATVGAGMLLQGFDDLAGLAAAAGLFLLAFAMYGSAMIALGALARDMPAAQNLSRPVFALLLAVFFVALGQLSGMSAAALPTLALVPPFAPFVLILAKPGAVDGLHLGLAVGGMTLSTVAGVWSAALALKGEVRRPRFLARRCARV